MWRNTQGVFYYFGRKITIMREAKIVAQKANFVLNFLPYVLE